MTCIHSDSEKADSIYTANIHSERIQALRAMMDRNGWDAVVLSGSDPHSSEYPASRWKQVEFLTGFNGEAGDLVVTADHAGLWTDARYFIQAVTQLKEEQDKQSGILSDYVLPRTRCRSIQDFS